LRQNGINGKNTIIIAQIAQFNYESKKSSVALKIMIIIILLVNLFIINEYREELGHFRNLLALLPLLAFLIRDKYVLHD
jgi:hypothetical protein